MGRAIGARGNWFDEADEVFEGQLRALGLGADQVGEQSLVELRDSLDQIDAAIARPEAFGVLNVKMTTDVGGKGGLSTILTTGTAESHMTLGILPLLLRRKRLIVSRIRELEAKASETEPTVIADGNSARRESSSQPRAMSRTVFVAHGRDQAAKNQVARLLEHLQLDAIILEEQPNRGRTVIEKFQQNALDVGFAVVVMTPDDCGAGPGEALPEKPNRARQNVLLELGYFMGALGRDRVTAVIATGVEQPSDILGIAYIPMDSDGWKTRLAQELNAAGLDVDFNLLFRSL